MFCLGCADAESIASFQVHQHEHVLSASPIVVFDANLNVLAMEALLTLCHHHNIPGKPNFLGLLLLFYFWGHDTTSHYRDNETSDLVYV